MAAFGQSFSWVFVFIGLIIFAFKMVVSLINMLFRTSLEVNTPGWLKYVGIAFIGLGILCILIFSNNKKNPLKRLFGGVAKLYDGVSILSDILSYSRLFGLGLASAVVGMVVNQVAMVFINMIPYVGYVVAVVILLVGHRYMCTDGACILFSYTFGGYVPGSGTAESYGTSRFRSFRNLHTLFHSGSTNSHSY